MNGNKKGTDMAKRNTAEKVQPEEMTETTEVEIISQGEVGGVEQFSTTIGIEDSELSTAAIDPIPLDEKGRKKEVRMSMEELEKLGLKNKSQMIRYLIAEGHSPSAVAKFMGVIYQHVRNVMFQQLKRPAPEAKVASTTKETEETSKTE